MPQRDWVDQAACRDEPYVTFYGTDDAPMSTAQVRAALSFCSVCPVRNTCLYTALSQRERHGIWGGMTPRQRKTLLEHVSGSTHRAMALVVGR